MSGLWLFIGTILGVPFGIFLMRCAETMFMTEREAKQYRQWQREGKL